MEAYKNYFFDTSDCQNFPVMEFIDATIASKDFPNNDIFSSAFYHIAYCPRCKHILGAYLEVNGLYPLLASLILADIK